MSYLTGLRCKECNSEYPAEALHVCELCFGPLEAEYDYEKIAANISREAIEAGPHTLWRYADLLPTSASDRIELGAGMTPLRKAPRLAAELGLEELYLKNEIPNPTNSFKDRVVSVALTKAKELGFTVVGCASTGNLANSVAAHAAASGMRSVVFIPHDLEAGKIVTTAVYGGVVVAVEGNYDDVNRLCAEIAGNYPWAFVNVNIRPYYSEGSKTIAFETVEQLGWSYPDHVVVPVASGSLLTKIKKGFEELHKVGIVEEPPSVRVSGAQAEGCSPVATAFLEDLPSIKPQKPNTVAKSLAIGNPADGYYALDAVSSTGGSFGKVSDEEIVEAVKLLARTEGIFTETAGGVTVASLIQLIERGVVRPDEKVVAYITGLGLKTLEAFEPDNKPSITVKPTLDDFARAYESLG
ncbi:MAG: threonine synthase [Acidimicrobiia bacterium]